MLNNTKKTLVLFCGHGSRDLNYQEEFQHVVNYVQKKNKNCDIFKCFIEINNPTIKKFFIEFKELETRKIFVFPILIFQGNHMELDIKKQIPTSKNISLCKNIDLNNKVLKTYEKNIKPIIKKDKIVLVTVSSFSKNKNVLFELDKYTKKLSKRIFSYKSYSCFYGSEMGVIEKLHNMKGKENVCLVVNPIFLFTGFLYKSVKKKFENLKFKNTFFTEPLMKEPEILNILSHRVTKVINSL